MNRSTTYHLTPDAVAWAVDGDATLALDLERGDYLGVNSSGTLLWNALESGATQAELSARLRQTYGLDAERADADAAAFLDACRSRGFLAD